MKNILVILFVVIGQQLSGQVDLNEKILGLWTVTRASVSETATDGNAVKSELAEKPTIYFKSNNTGNFNLPDKDSESFTWTVLKNKIIIVYTGSNEILKSFNGDFRAVYRDRKGEQKLDMTRNNFSAFLSRKP